MCAAASTPEVAERRTDAVAQRGHDLHDPVVFTKYAIDVADACPNERGIKTVADPPDTLSGRAPISTAAWMPPTWTSRPLPIASYRELCSGDLALWLKNPVFLASRPRLARRSRPC